MHGYKFANLLLNLLYGLWGPWCLGQASPKNLKVRRNVCLRAAFVTYLLWSRTVLFGQFSKSFLHAQIPSLSWKRPSKQNSCKVRFNVLLLCLPRIEFLWTKGALIPYYTSVELKKPSLEMSVSRTECKFELDKILVEKLILHNHDRYSVQDVKSFVEKMKVRIG